MAHFVSILPTPQAMKLVGIAVLLVSFTQDNRTTSLWETPLVEEEEIVPYMGSSSSYDHYYAICTLHRTQYIKWLLILKGFKCNL